MYLCNCTSSRIYICSMFSVIKKMGYDWHDKLVHVPFGMVSMETESFLRKVMLFY